MVDRPFAIWVTASGLAYIVPEFHERFDRIDFLQLPKCRTYVKLMIDGAPSKPYSAVSLAPHQTEVIEAETC